jgi:hypothetical protein
LICEATFSGKKHYKIVLKVLATPKKSCEGRRRFTFHKLTSPGGSLEVQDEGKFFAEPYNKEENTNS